MSPRSNLKRQVFLSIVTSLLVFGLWPSAAAASDQPLLGIIVAIDPGHGGVDAGTRVAGRNLLEKDVNLALALALRNVLQNLGAEVIMTRETDTELSHSPKLYKGRHREDLSNRVKIIADSGCDIFVSMHANSLPGHPGTRGARVFYYRHSETSRLMAQIIQGELNSMNLQPFGTTTRPFEAAPAGFFVLRTTPVPGVLVEAGHLSNAVDRRLLASAEFHKAFAETLARGIAAALSRPLP